MVPPPPTYSTDGEEKKHPVCHPRKTVVSLIAGNCLFKALTAHSGSHMPRKKVYHSSIPPSSCCRRRAITFSSVEGDVNPNPLDPKGAMTRRNTNLNKFFIFSSFSSLWTGDENLYNIQLSKFSFWNLPFQRKCSS